MAKQLVFRITGAAGLLALAVVFLGLGPFLSAGANPAAPVAVDRSLKSDRLPVAHEAAVVPDRRYEFGAFNPQPQAHKPFACDAAFSTIVAPAAANFFGRCLT